MDQECELYKVARKLVRGIRCIYFIDPRGLHNYRKAGSAFRIRTALNNLAARARKCIESDRIYAEWCLK